MVAEWILAARDFAHGGIDLARTGTKMNHFGGPVHEVFDVIAQLWRNFSGAASSPRVEGTRLAATPASGRASTHTPSDDALTSWESEGGSLDDSRY